LSSWFIWPVFCPVFPNVLKYISVRAAREFSLRRARPLTFHFDRRPGSLQWKLMTPHLACPISHAPRGMLYWEVCSSSSSCSCSCSCAGEFNFLNNKNCFVFDKQKRAGGAGRACRRSIKIDSQTNKSMPEWRDAASFGTYKNTP